MQYTIREIARLFGNTVGAIRFYETEGLVNPQRDESGNRVYTMENILELFYLKKYCSYGLKIREVTEYFHEQNTKSLDDVEGLLEEKLVDAQAMALYYQKSAEWIARYQHTLRNLEHSVGRLVPIVAPDYYLLMDEQLVSKRKDRQEIAQKWIAAAPLTRISTLTRMEGGRILQKQACFAADAQNARELRLPLPDYTKRLRGARCMHTILRIPSTGFDYIRDEDFLEGQQRMEAMGVTPSGYSVSNILFTHNMDGVQYKYFEMWFPYDVELPLLGGLEG